MLHWIISWFTALGRIERQIIETNRLLRLVIQKGEIMDEKFSELLAGVAEITDAADAAMAVMQNQAAILADIADDPAQVRAMAETLTSKAAEIRAAIAANTPGAPADPPAEPA